MIANKTVRAKFTCDSVEITKGQRPAADAKYDARSGYDNYDPCKCYTVRMSPVYGGVKGENQKFWSATPSGKLEMQVMNQPAAEMFEPGKSYYLDFTPAPDA